MDFADNGHPIHLHRCANHCGDQAESETHQAEGGTMNNSRLVKALSDLLSNPFPHDLVRLRREAAEYENETEARLDMDEFCSQAYCDASAESHIRARKQAEGVLREAAMSTQSSQDAPSARRNPENASCEGNVKTGGN